MPSARQKKRQRLAKRQRQAKARAANATKAKDAQTPRISEPNTRGALASEFEDNRENKPGSADESRPRTTALGTRADDRHLDIAAATLKAAESHVAETSKISEHKAQAAIAGALEDSRDQKARRPEDSTAGIVELNTQAELSRLPQLQAEPNSETTRVWPKGTLHLKRPVEQGTVRQSFSHGRSKVVVVEKKRRVQLNLEELRLRGEQDEASRKLEEELRQQAESDAQRLEKELRRAEEEARQRFEEEVARAKQEAKRKAEEEIRRELNLQASSESVGRSVEKVPVVLLQPIEIVPGQTQRAIAFTSGEFGPLAMVPDPADELVDREQAELYTRMRGQLHTLIEQVPSQERSQISKPIDDFLSQPADWRQVKYKKVLWLCGNALRNTLAQHDAVSRDFDPHYSKLPPALAEALRRPVETWNVVVLGDQILRELDTQRLGPQEVEPARNTLVSAKPILTAAAENKAITTKDAASAIEASLAAATISGDNIHTRQAQQLAQGTSQNLIVQILRGALRTAHDLQDPRSDEARVLVKEYKSGIYKKLGEWTVTGAAVGTTGAVAATYLYGIPFLEFVVGNGDVFKIFIGNSFNNPQLTQIVDSVVNFRKRLYM